MISEALSLPSYTERLQQEGLPVFLYGMGDGAEKIYGYLKSHGIAIEGVVASDEFVRGQEFLGFKVRKISDAEKEFGRLALVVCFGLEGEKCRFLYSLAKKHLLISPNLPVFGENACDKDFISENAEKFERVYSLLADDISKEIFKALLKYNISGDIDYLLNNNGLVPPREFYSHTKRHVDVGAYDGDTAVEFANCSDTYRDIIAFEPDENSFKKLLKNTENLRNVVAINGAVGQKEESICFDSGRGRASHASDFGRAVKCHSIDSFCGFSHIDACGVPVGSIKIDAEGMDEKVIFGAVNTIYACKCHVAVALYHRYDDLINLPLLLQKHNHKYKFYLRKKEYIPAWDVFLYAISKGD